MRRRKCKVGKANEGATSETRKIHTIKKPQSVLCASKPESGAVQSNSFSLGIIRVFVMLEYQEGARCLAIAQMTVRCNQDVSGPEHHQHQTRLLIISHLRLKMPACKFSL